MSGYIRQVIVTEEDTGNVIHDSISKGSQNGKGFVLMYTDKILHLLKECQSASTLKVFMYLATGQQYEDRGMITTKKAVQESLGITKPTCLEAFRWLKEHFIVNECKVNGCTEFMVNPEYVTIGRDKKKRMDEWLRRWSGQTVKTITSPKKSKRSID